MSDTPRYMTPEAMAAFREAQERAGTLPELRNAPTADLSGFFGMLPGGQLSGPILTELQRKYLPLGVTETGNPDFYGPIAAATSYVPGIDPRNRAIRAQRMADELRSLDEIAIGAEDFTGALSNIGRGAGGFRDYATAALSVLPFDGVGRAIGRRVLGVPVVGEGLQRIVRWLSHFDPIADNADDVLEAAFREGATADEIMQLSQEVGTPAEWDSVVNAVAAREAGARYEPGAVVNRRPKYAVREEGPALRVEREGLQREANPALAEGSIADLRVRMADPEQNAALRLANEEAIARTGQPLDLTSLPQTSLRRQGGIARMFDAAAEGGPDYKSALFEQYGLQMPQVVEQAGAQNYDQLTEAAYRQLAEEAQQQFDRLPVGMNYHYGELEYPTPSAMFRDALGRGELNVFRGGDPHPFLSDIDPATRLTGNEQFRAVHDYIGHGASGSTFRPGGEEIAYATHAQTLSPLAQMALLSETRGQNSWVNYGPANVDLIAQMDNIRGQLAGAGGSEADALRRQLRELGGEFQYAAQEPVLLPPEYLAVNSEGGVPDWARKLIVPRAPSGARGVHYSRAEGLQRTDPSFYGTGHIGEERRMVRREGLPDRTYFYAEGADGSPIRPEEAVAQRAPFVYEADLQGLYDVNADPERLVALANLYNRDGSALPDLERLIQQYGYSGYISDYAPSWAPQSRRAAAVFEPVGVRPR